MARVITSPSVSRKMPSLLLFSWRKYYFHSQKHPDLNSKLITWWLWKLGQSRVTLSGGCQRGLTKAADQACPLPSLSYPWTLTPSPVAQGGHSPLPFPGCPGRAPPTRPALPGPGQPLPWAFPWAGVKAGHTLRAQPQSCPLVTALRLQDGEGTICTHTLSLYARLSPP